MFRKSIIAILILLLAFSLSACGKNSAPINLEQATIVLGETYQSFDPFSDVASDHQYLYPIYEGLVGFDQELQIQPKLSYSYGKLDDLTWQFKIRSNTKFHDGTDFTPQLVEQTFQAVSQLNYAHLEDLVKNIASVKATDAETVVFKLNEVDPEFLRRLTQVPIISTSDLSELLVSPNGTGPYRVTDITADHVTYQIFTEYWGGSGKVPEITYKILPSKAQRLNATATESNILAVLPYPVDGQTEVNKDQYEFVSQPDLTVNFFVWNSGDDFWDQAENRQKLQSVFPYAEISQLTSEQGIPAGQFVSNGILGFVPGLDPDPQTKDQLAKLVEKSGLSGQLVRFAVPPSLENFGLQLEVLLRSIGLDAEAYIVKPEQIFDSEQVAGINLLFLGWRSNLGTATNFFQSFLRADSSYNIAKYSNLKVNQLLVELANTEADEDRIPILQEMMTEISQEDPFGVPLFYGRLPYLLNKDYHLPVRLDGIVMIDELQ